MVVPFAVVVANCRSILSLSKGQLPIATFDFAQDRQLPAVEDCLPLSTKKTTKNP